MQTVGSPYSTLMQIEQNTQQKKKKSSDENCLIKIMMSSLKHKE
jgi:hypothetical protein